MTGNLPSFISGSVALVTGAGRGVGRALALELARRGAKVACIARSADQIGDTLRAIQEEGAGTNLDRRPVESSVSEDFIRTLEVNLIGVYNTVKAGIPFLKESGGHIVLIGSGIGLRGNKNSAAYACSKAGVHVLTQVLSEELKSHSIAVNEFIPGPVRTELSRPLWEKNDGVFSIEDEWIKNPEETTSIMMALLSCLPAKSPSGQTYSLTRRVL